MFFLIANILNGVMRAAELDSHMGSMKVSATTTAPEWFTALLQVLICRF